MAVLVTGGAGYIGSHMAWELLDAGEEVVVLDNLTTGHKWSVPRKAKFVHGDIGDPRLLIRVMERHDIDAIIHMAGSTIVPESVSLPLAYYHNNTAKLRTLLEAAVSNSVKHFVFSSTAAVYGNVPPVPVREDQPLNPQSPYGRSKMMSEMILEDVAAAHDLQFAILRYFNVAGSDPKGRTGQSTQNATHLIKVACEAATGRRPHLSIFGTDYDTPDGTAVRDFIHVSDLVHAHRLALTHLRGQDENVIANCGYGRGFSVRDVVEVIEAVSGSYVRTLEEARRPGDLESVVANSDRLRSLLDWQPHYDDLEAIIGHALAWERTLQEKSEAKLAS